jgi:hypothetical protein
MKKSDLKTGMVVEHSGGSRGLIVCNSIIYQEGGYSPLKLWNEDFTTNHEYGKDIVKVFEFKSDITYGLNTLYIDSLLDVVWKREEQIHVWKPKDGGKYFYPDFASRDRYIYDTFVENNAVDSQLYGSLLCFHSAKYARWISQRGMHPAILQAALAVDGLASRESFLGDDCLYFIDSYLGCSLFILASPFRYLNRVYFKSENKADQALKGIMPNGKTLEQYLLDEVKEVVGDE